MTSFILVLIIALTLIELVLRLFPPDWLRAQMRIMNTGVGARQFGTDFGWPVERKNGTIFRFVQFSELRMVHYEYDEIAHVDQTGARATEFCSESPGSEPIPFLGDSMTFGVGVKDDETYVSLLGRKFSMCFANLGIPGSSLGPQLKLIQGRHAELGNPKIYVLNFFLGNDLDEINSGNPDQSNGAVQDGVPKEIQVPTWLVRFNLFVFYHNPVLKKLYLVQFVKAKALGLYNRLRLRRGQFQYMTAIFWWMNQNKEYLQETELHLDHELEELVRLSNVLKFRPLFILIPDKYQWSQLDRETKAKYYGLRVKDLDPEFPNRFLRKKLDQWNIPYLDILPCLRKESEQLYYIQGKHFTRRGHEIVADCIQPELAAFLMK
ncbi:MAG: SGNH/GDSL hydrolase family protein [Candidatus Omnitrophica bacterium]|nr:SGNH/GDSL hydrolase family protein [Candidatus Omnitrophota bacterium]